MALTSIFTLIAAVAAAVFAKHASSQSKRSADTAQLALLASERAWVNAEVAALGPLKFDMHGDVSLLIGITIQNVGKTPAINVHTDVGMTSRHNDIPEILGSFAVGTRSVDLKSSKLLLPGQHYLRRWVASMQLADGEDWVLPVVIGTITYQVLPDLSLHQTAFSFMLSIADEASDTSLLTRGVEVPPQYVVIEGNPGGFAD